MILPFSRSGSALLIVLPIVAIVTLVILTLLSISLFDNRFAASSFEQMKAQSLAKFALDDVSDKLYQIPLDRHWASGPGRIRYWDGNASWNTIDLHSGADTSPLAADYLDGTTAAAAAKCVHLNVPLSDGSYSIMSANAEYATAPEMTVKWIYVLQDGTTQADATPSTTHGPVVGRYGYWTDVENGRVNINTAGLGMVNRPGANDSGRFTWALENWVKGYGPHVGYSTADIADYIANVLTPNPWATDRVSVSASGVTFPNLDQVTAQQNTIQNLTAHPSSIDLAFLDGVSEAQSFDTFRYAGSYFLRVDALRACLDRNLYDFVSPAPTPDLGIRFFNDPKDWNLIVGSDPTIYQRNKGYLTTKGRSPEINPWGLNKIPLSLVPSDGDSLNDLTEFYSRTVQSIYPNVEDSRPTQVPKTYGTYDGGGGEITAPPWPPMVGESTFRDLSATVPFYASGGGNDFGFVATLVNDLTTTLNLTPPGFATSLGSKYNSQMPSSPGESEQFAVELMTFLDGCLDVGAPGYAYYECENSALDPYNFSLPLAAKVTGAPYTNVRRQGLSGEFLLNEIGLEAQPVAYSQIYPPTQPPPPAPNQNKFSVSMSLPYPKAMLLAPLNNSEEQQILFFLREPTDDNPLDGTSHDKYINVILQGEGLIPAHFGLMPTFPRDTSVAGGLGNTVLEWSTDDINWHTLNYDVYGDQKMNGSGTGPITSSDNPAPNGFAPYSYTTRFGTASAYGALQFRDSVAVPTPPADTYAIMGQVTGECIVIGPFPPGTIVSFKIKTRVMFINDISWMAVPGIFPNFPSGNPADPSYLGFTTPPAPPSDPNDPSQAELDAQNLPFPPPDPNYVAFSNITNNFLEFDFKDMNVDLPNSQEVDFEATDPRVIGHKADWLPCGNPGGDTLGNVNSVGGGPPRDSDIARPPAFLAYARGLVRNWCLAYAPNGGNTGEIQTASRILGLPGVGHLAGVSTGADSGIPWSTVKFEKGLTSPPDWLLWNLFYVPFDRSMTNDTDGKININAKLYPFKDINGNDLIREKPLEALLGNRVDNPSTLAQAIAAGPTYTNGGTLPSDLYVYAGQLCEVPGIADSGADDYDMERLPRDLADIVTTQSSDFRVFIVAQTLKQSSTGQITPVTTQRIETTLSRVVDTGNPGYGFGARDSGGYPFNVYRRDAYRPTATGATVPSAVRFDANNTGLASSDLGADHIPNTGDDWIIPRKIEVTSYKVIK